MEYVIIWFLFGIVAAIIANNKGRSGCLWFLAGGLFGPFSLIILALPSLKPGQQQPTPKTHVQCPDCAELIRKEARVCKHCGCRVIPDSEVGEEFTKAEEIKNTIPYRGGVVVAANKSILFTVCIVATLFFTGLVSYEKYISAENPLPVETKKELDEIYTMPAVVVRLSGKDNRYAKLQIALQVTPAGLLAIQNGSAAIMNDAVASALGAMTFTQINDPKEKMKLRDILLEAAKNAIGKKDVADIFLTELLVQ